MRPRPPSRSAGRVKPPVDITLRRASPDIGIPTPPASASSASTLYSAIETSKRAKPASTLTPRVLVSVEQPPPALVLQGVQTLCGHAAILSTGRAVHQATWREYLCAQTVSAVTAPFEPMHDDEKRPMEGAVSAANARPAFELGYMTFVEITQNPLIDEMSSPTQRTRETIE